MKVKFCSRGLRRSRRLIYNLRIILAVLSRAAKGRKRVSPFCKSRPFLYELVSNSARFDFRMSVLQLSSIS